MHSIAPIIVVSYLVFVHHSEANPDARRLFEDLLSDYNKLIRPVGNTADMLQVKFKMRLSQLLDVHEKNQIMTSNVWLEHEWYDYKLTWKPHDYGNVTVLYVPAEMIWLPDIVLYNNADGNYEVTIMTKAAVSHTGRVNWDPPAIYKSMCHIDVEWFPFDEQTCAMKFGSWTYDGTQVDLLHKSNETIVEHTEKGILVECVENGIDLSDYYRSTEWDLLAVPGWKKREIYPCCPTPYIDITYRIVLRRKTLFYSVNLIVPCIGISLLTVLVFYLPSASGEKVSLSISILISLTVFFLLLVEIIPSTSIVIPLIGKYLLFTMIMVSLSITVTVVVINHHFRSPSTHTMSPFIRTWFLKIMPPFLFMSRPLLASDSLEEYNRKKQARRKKSTREWMVNSVKNSTTSCDGVPLPAHNNSYRSAKVVVDEQQNSVITKAVAGDEPSLRMNGDTRHVYGNDVNKTFERNGYCAFCKSSGPRHTHDDVNCGAANKPKEEDGSTVIKELGIHAKKTLANIQFIADHFKQQDAEEKFMEEWRFVAMVIDRVFLVLFALTCVIGTASIIFQAPSLYDDRLPLNDGDQQVISKLNGVAYCDKMYGKE